MNSLFTLFCVNKELFTRCRLRQCKDSKQINGIQVERFAGGTLRYHASNRRIRVLCEKVNAIDLHQKTIVIDVTHLVIKELWSNTQDSSEYVNLEEQLFLNRKIRYKMHLLSFEL